MVYCKEVVHYILKIIYIHSKIQIKVFIYTWVYLLFFQKMLITKLYCDFSHFRKNAMGKNLNIINLEYTDYPAFGEHGNMCYTTENRIPVS